MTNEQVIYAWLNYRGASSSNGNLSTNGTDLYSYNLKIASHRDGQNRVWDYTSSGNYYSQTTSCHVGLAIRHAGNFILMNPNSDGSVEQFYRSQDANS